MVEVRDEILLQVYIKLNKVSCESRVFPYHNALMATIIIEQWQIHVINHFITNGFSRSLGIH